MASATQPTLEPAVPPPVMAYELPTATAVHGAEPVPGDTPSTRYRKYVLGILVVVYTLNFVDRQILAILAKPFLAVLLLSVCLLGLLGGLAFVLLYLTMVLPIVAWADRGSRRNIMTWALALWSGFTALCGLTGSFLTLFLARVGVGVGEAGGDAPAYSMLADYFPKSQRARALAVYSLGIPLGGAAGILFGGLIAKAISWRAAFLIVGGVGVLVAPIFRFTVKDPRRGGYESNTAVPARARTKDVFAIVAKKPSFWLLAFGAASSSVCGYGLAFWLPSFFGRSLSLSYTDTAWYYAAITFFGGGLGIVGGGILADRLGKANRSAYPVIPAAAFPLFLIPTGLYLMWLGPILTAVQHLVPAHMRTTASAMFLMINNLIGIAIGLYYFGAVSDALKPHFGAESLRYAIYTGLGFYLVAAVLFVAASRKIKRDWVE